MFFKNIANFISNFDYNQASPETINVAKAAFIDYFGVAYRGFKENPSYFAFLTINEIYGEATYNDLTSSIIGEDKIKQNMLSAAFINGISAHSLDLDDGHRGAHLHLGAVVFSTALSISEAYNLSGKEFLEAVILGYEIGILLGKLVNPKHRNNGFHSTGTIGTFAAGAVAAKLLKLDEERITSALGLSGTQAAGLLESDHSGSMGKSLHVGKAAFNGMLSAFLAKNGFTGSSSIFDGEEGFLKTMVFNDSLDEYSLEDLLMNVGDVDFRDIYFKKYPFCRHLHSSIEAILKLRPIIDKEYGHIDSILVKTYDIAASHDNYNPKSLEELKQSLPYAVAIALACGNLSIDNIKLLIRYGLFDENSNVDIVKTIRNLANKVVISVDPKLNQLYPSKRPSNVVIRLDENFRNGVFQNLVIIPKGDLENPYELNDLITKFKELNPKYNINKLSIIDDIENYQMTEFMEILNGND
ncbi:MAG: MmgE/PrpD family protein [Methanobrevibacter sp.]|uniref:MmgE/PrpD family protein n=1 Tax=Methanobrevibacter sp. TaxID=66852 RepID=UPI0026DF16F0|nr:MmgE/PrpD family protein [Methanobrevibacter sp.]MDO5848923.1 MmgE/PrpD family protein [Methanobrevibacter sp.]